MLFHGINVQPERSSTLLPVFYKLLPISSINYRTLIFISEGWVLHVTCCEWYKFYSTLKTTFSLTPNAQAWPRALNTFLGGNPNDIYLVVHDLGIFSGQGFNFINGQSFLCVLNIILSHLFRFSLNPGSAFTLYMMPWTNGLVLQQHHSQMLLPINVLLFM